VEGLSTEDLTAVVLDGTTITESRLLRNLKSSDLGSLGACELIERTPIELKDLYRLKASVLYKQTVSPVVDLRVGSFIRYHFRSYRALMFMKYYMTII
jgi:hypothetical protein